MDKTQERIKADAERYTKDEGYQKAYIAGATAENKRAQKMIKALDQLKEGAPNHTIIFIDKVIKKWKGTGKEVTKPTKIETCGHCGNQPASNYIGNQLYLCDECMEKHTEDCY